MGSSRGSGRAKGRDDDGQRHGTQPAEFARHRHAVEGCAHTAGAAVSCVFHYVSAAGGRGGRMLVVVYPRGEHLQHLAMSIEAKGGGTHKT